MVRDRVTRRNIGLAVLFVVVVFGALVQTGVLMPKFRDGNEGGSSSEGLAEVSANTVENQSLRSWTITGMQLPQGKTESLPDGSTVHIGGIYRGPDVNPVLQGQSPAQATPLTIGPGQQFTVKLVRDFPPACGKTTGPKSLAQLHNLEAVRWPSPSTICLR